MQDVPTMANDFIDKVLPHLVQNNIRSLSVECPAGGIVHVKVEYVLGTDAYDTLFGTDNVEDK